MQESTGGHGSFIKGRGVRGRKKGRHNAGVRSDTDKCTSLIIHMYTAFLNSNLPHLKCIVVWTRTDTFPLCTSNKLIMEV